MTTLLGNHHPFCRYVFETWNRNIHSSWRCECDLLKKYDFWREKNTVMKTSKKYLKKLKDA